jgi:hypothetical protein
VNEIEKAKKEVSVNPELAKLKRNDVEGALDLYRKAKKLNRERRLAGQISDVAHQLLMLQDQPDALREMMLTIARGRE